MIAFHWASGSRGMETKPQVFIRLQNRKILFIHSARLRIRHFRQRPKLVLIGCHVFKTVTYNKSSDDDPNILSALKIESN